MKALVLMTVMLFAVPAHAYLDPGTGSMILQVILGGVAAASVALKLYWQRIKGFFVKDDAASNEPETSEVHD
jgi:hypothetical protein